MSKPEPISATGRWLALVAALLGWMFDGVEMGLFPLVARPALGELLGPSAAAESIGRAFALITALFLIGAATGGVLFGWLGDRIGRVRALTLSVLVYATCSGLSAASTSVWHLAALRFLGALGMGGEWALGVALVMEIWPDAKRPLLASTIGAAGNLGYAVVGGVAFALNRLADQIPGWLIGVGVPDTLAASLTAHNNWRLLMLLGAAPAGLTILIRLMVPESPRWLAGQSTRPGSQSRDLFSVLLGAGVAVGIVGVWASAVPLGLRSALTLAGLAAVTMLFLAPARRLVPPGPERVRVVRRMLLGAGLSAVPLLATWAGIMWMYQWVDALTHNANPDARPLTQIVSSVGAGAGAAVAPFLAIRFGRRLTYAALCVIAAGVLTGFYTLNTQFGPLFLVSAGLVGSVCAAFYGWLPLYLPELFPTAVRTTGQGFAFNFGRIIAAIGTLQTGALLAYFGGDYARACSLIAGVYLVGIVLIWFAPVTHRLPD